MAKKLTDQLTASEIFMSRVAHLIASSQASPDFSEVMAAQLPDVISAYMAVRTGVERRARATEVAHLAASFLHGTLETTEDEGELREHSKRAVRLAELLLTEAGA